MPLLSRTPGPAAPEPVVTPSPGSRRAALAAAALAVGGGVLWGLTFSRHATWWLPPLALVPLFLLLDRRRAGWLGWLHGIAGWTTAMSWIVHTLTVYGMLPGWLAGLALLALAAYLGLYHALFAALGARLWRSPSRAAWLALPALWVALEWLRGMVVTGFPWNLAASSWTTMPGALPLAAWVGAFGVSWLLVATTALAARAWRRRDARLATLAVLLPAILLPVAGRWAAGSPDGESPAKWVRVVQPNTPNLVVWDAEAVGRQTERLFAMSRAACDRPALLVWPESAAWPYEYPRDLALRQAVDELAARGCPVLLNTPTSEGERTFNSALLVGAAGVEARYDKRHLVPFGEYVPWRDTLPFVGKIARRAGDFSPAREVSLLPLGADLLGVAICFEVIFPGEVAELVRAGATVLVTMTNDAWYGDTAAPWQHLRAAQFRAAENRRPLLRAAVTGVSAVVAPDGRLLAALGVGEQGTLAAPVAGRSDLAPFTRAPWLVPALAWVVALAGLAWTRVVDFPPA